LADVIPRTDTAVASVATIFFIYKPPQVSEVCLRSECELKES
jgi:hypothetical protein